MGSRVLAGTLQKIRDGVITDGPVYLQVLITYSPALLTPSTKLNMAEYIAAVRRAGFGAAATGQKASWSVLRRHRQH